MSNEQTTKIFAKLQHRIEFSNRHSTVEEKMHIAVLGNVAVVSSRLSDRMFGLVLVVVGSGLCSSAGAEPRAPSTLRFRARLPPRARPLPL